MTSKRLNRKADDLLNKARRLNEPAPVCPECDRELRVLVMLPTGVDLCPGCQALAEKLNRPLLIMPAPMPGGSHDLSHLATSEIKQVEDAGGVEPLRKRHLLATYREEYGMSDEEIAARFPDMLEE